MTFEIDIQTVTKDPLPVDETTVKQWVTRVLSDHQDAAELTLRFVDEAEIRALNQTYRKLDKPTNVLAFPFNMPNIEALDIPLLGDVIVCLSVVKSESETQHKPYINHLAHIIIHGVLHLLGYDHIKEDDALVMQTKEILYLNELNIENPYLMDGDDIVF